MNGKKYSSSSQYYELLAHSTNYDDTDLENTFVTHITI